MGGRKLFLYFVLALLCISLSACTMAKISGKGPLPLMLNQPQAKVEVIKSFEKTKSRQFDHTGSFDVSEVISDVMSGEEGADAIINLDIAIKVTPGDFFLNLITLGIANSMTFQVSGQLVKTSGSLSSIPENLKIGESEDLKTITPMIMKNSKNNGSKQMLVVDKKSQGKPTYKLIQY